MDPDRSATGITAGLLRCFPTNQIPAIGLTVKRGAQSCRFHAGTGWLTAAVSGRIANPEVIHCR